MGIETKQTWRWGRHNHLEELKVNTEFKIKYHGDELDKDIWRTTTKKHNELVDELVKILNDMQEEIADLKRPDHLKRNIK